MIGQNIFVDDVFNAIKVTGNMLGEAMFYGRGAGPLPTGSAVLGDVIGVARKLEKDSAYDIVPQLRYDSDLEFAGEGASKYFVRMSVPERAGILGVITTIFGNRGISIETILQKSPYEVEGEAVADLLIKVFSVEKPELMAALEEACESGVVKSIDNIMRVEE